MEGKKKGERKGGNYLEKENTILWRRRKTEKENEDNIWRRKISFCGGEEKERKYLEKDFFCEGGIYNGEENIVAGGRTSRWESKVRKRS